MSGIRDVQPAAARLYLAGERQRPVFDFLAPELVFEQSPVEKVLPVELLDDLLDEGPHRRRIEFTFVAYQKPSPRDR